MLCLFYLQALSVLKVLITEALSSSIALLDPFPDSTKFKNLNKIYNQIKEKTRRSNLLEDIKRFLIVSSGSLPASRLEGLRYLRSQLGSRKDDLQVLLQNNKGAFNLTFYSIQCNVTVYLTHYSCLFCVEEF